MQKIYNEQITEIKLFNKLTIFTIKKVIREALEDDIQIVNYKVTPEYYKEEFNG